MTAKIAPQAQFKARARAAFAHMKQSTLAAFRANQSAANLNLLRANGFQLPSVQPQGTPHLIPLLPLSHDIRPDLLTVEPSIVQMFRVESSYPYVPGYESTQRHPVLTQHDVLDLYNNIHTSTGELLLKRAGHWGHGGLTRALICLHEIYCAEWHLDRLPASETDARIQISQRLVLLKEEIEALKQSKTEQPQNDFVSVVLSGHPDNPDQQEQIVQCDFRWLQGRHAIVGNSFIADRSSSTSSEYEAQVQKTRMRYLELLNTHSTKLAGRPLKPDALTQAATLWGSASNTLHMEMYPRSQYLQSPELSAEFPLQYPVMGAHMSAVADHLGVDGINATYAELQAAYPSLWV